jgi:hypothetical protein
VATNQSVIDRVRLELGDQSTTFDVSVFGNGTATRFETGTYPLDGAALTITVDGVPENNATVEERTGVVVFDTAPADGAQVRFRGTKFRYFGAVDLQSFIDAAVAEHTLHRTDSFGRKIGLSTLPPVEEYPLALLATVKALWALATDAAFDIDILAPDGVNIPREQRFRQLMEMIDARMMQYKDLCTALNIGLYRVEVFNLRRVSKMTGRLVPVWIEREIEDNSTPVRVYLPTNTYGADPIPTSSGVYDLAFTQGDAYSITLDFDLDLTNYDIEADIRLFPQSQVESLTFAVTRVNDATGVVTLSLTPEQTRKLPVKSVWDVQLKSKSDPNDIRTPLTGQVFVTRDVTR